MLKGISYENDLYTLAQLNEENDLSKSLPKIIRDYVANNTRKWEGKPHVTDLCIDTREVYLKYTQDYYEDVSSIIRTTFGSLRHESILSGPLSEIKLENVNLKGSADNIDIFPNGDIFVCDFKFYSSYSVAKHLGIKTTKIDAVDSFGNVAYSKNGKPKKETVIQYVPPNKIYITLQLNIYRHLLEEAILSSNPLRNAIRSLGGHIDENIKAGKVFDGMGVFMFVTDGGSYMAKSRGIDKLSYYDTDIDNIPQIDSIIERKVNNIVNAMNNNKLPPLCKDVYCMDDRYKCKNFCSVRHICNDLGGEIERPLF